MTHSEMYPEMQVAKTFSEHISQYTAVVIESLAYAGTGDVLKIQQLISIAGEHIEVEEDTQWKVRHCLPPSDLCTLRNTPVCFVPSPLYHLILMQLVASSVPIVIAAARVWCGGVRRWWCEGAG